MKFYYQRLFILLICLNLLSTGCSSEEKASLDIIINGPKTIEITAKHEEFVVQFSKISSIGAENSKILPYFEFYINTIEDINTAENIGKVQQLDDGSGLMRQFIKPIKTEADGENIVLIYPIKDEVEYFVWVRACYNGYGCSGYTMTKATPVPYPSKLTKDDVEVYAGDTTILIKIKNKNKYDDFGILADNDCLSPKLQRFDPKFTTSSDNLVITGLTNNTSYPVCIRAQNINTDTSNPETINWLQLGEIQPVASTFLPKQSVIEKGLEGHKRVSVKWAGDYEGNDAASLYEVIYSNAENIEKTEKVVTDTYNIEHTILQLVNGEKYNIKVRAINSAGSVDSNTITLSPMESVIDFNNLDTVLGKTSGRFIYAEDVPHSDFWRIDATNPKGGRASSDRLIRGKETALGNLWSDAVQYYVNEKLNKNTDFTVLAGEMITNGIENGVSITPKLLMGLTEINYIEDTIVIISIKGKYLINPEIDYNIDLNNYPALGANNVAVSLFGQAAAIYRNGHYGTGAGASAYATKAWLMPSREVNYAIEYMPYSLLEFEENFKNKCGEVSNMANYDSINDPNGCYLLKYNDVVGYNSPKEGYRRGRIQADSLKINGNIIEPEKIYRVATTKKLANSMYTAFIYAENIEYTDVVFWKAVADYINEQGNIFPYLDGRVKLIGGVPGNSANDYK